MTAGYEIALAHAARGRRVFPWKPLTKPGKTKLTKQPLPEHGHLDATTDERTIIDWWKRWPDARAGWALPVGIGLVDIDDQAVFAASGLSLPPGPEQVGTLTRPDGLHRLYVVSDGRQTQGVLPGADTRVGGDGWVALYSPDAFAGEPGPAPDWFPRAHRNGNGSTNGAGNGTAVKGPTVVATALASGRLFLADGERDGGLASIAGLLIGKGATPEATEAALALLDAAGAIERVPGDTLTADDFRRIAFSVARTDVRRNGHDARPDTLAALLPSWRTFTDADREPPGPLIVERLPPGEHTILFGPGDVGKGTVAADWIVRATLVGLRVCIVDYESHAGEWARRIWDLGGAAATAAVAYVNPTAAPFPPGALTHHVEALRAVADDFGADVIVIDSISAACGGDPLEAAVPWAYQAAVVRLGRTTLSLAHVTKAHEMAYPFGSVMWHNAPRMTWSLEQITDGVLKLRCRKSNAYRKSGDALVTPLWVDDHIREVGYRDFVASVAERIEDLLADGVGRTQAEIRAALLDPDDKPLGESTIRNALSRNVGPDKRFTCVRSGVRSLYSLRAD